MECRNETGQETPVRNRTGAKKVFSFPVHRSGSNINRPGNLDIQFKKIMQGKKV